MFEAVANVRSLTGGDFEGDVDLEARTSGVNFIEGSRDGLDSCEFSRADVGAGVSDEIRDIQNLAALHLVNKRGNRARAQRGVGRTEIQQIGIVGNNGVDAGFLAIDLKLLDLVFRERLGGPLPRRLGKNLDGVAIDLLAFKQRIADAAGDGHVGAQKRAARPFVDFDHGNLT